MGPTLCNPMGCSLPGSSVHGVLQASILKWVAILFSRASSQPKDQSQVSCTAGRFFTTEPCGKLFLEVCCVLSRFGRVQSLTTPWTVARQAPLSTGFSKQEHWNGLPCPPPRDPPNPGLEPASLMSPALPVDSSPLAPPGGSSTQLHPEAGTEADHGESAKFQAEAIP